MRLTPFVLRANSLSPTRRVGERDGVRGRSFSFLKRTSISKSKASPSPNPLPRWAGERDQNQEHPCAVT